jgi:hypothetical protein
MVMRTCDVSCVVQICMLTKTLSTDGWSRLCKLTVDQDSVNKQLIKTLSTTSCSRLCQLSDANSILSGSGDAAGPSNQQQQRQPSKVGDQELPVFCVSAKDCQRLEGRTSKDGPPSAFTKLEHTELPQLRAHVHHVTGRVMPPTHVTPTVCL